ncbi:MAG: hypothetical protein LC772_05345, partial [Chloroflexi bacterium]|nr:hypothetical protein [Chloroflexota bacterium]
MAIAEDLEQTRVKTEPETPEPVLPDAVQEALQRLLPAEETVAAFLECDLLPEGAFGKCWLFGTARRIGLYVPGSSRELAVDLPLEQVEKLERRDLHGVTVIEAITADRAIVAARMTPARLDDLGTALPKIQKLVPGMHSEERPHWRRKKENSKVCPTCGNPLPPWNGVCVDCLQKRKLLFRLLGRVKSYWPLVTLGLGLMLTIQIANLAGPLLNRMLIDRAIGGRHLNILWIVLGIMILLSVISQALGAFRQYLMAWFGQKVIYDLRAELYNHLQRLSIAFYDSKQTGWIMDRITSDTSNLQDFLTDALQDFVMACMSLVGIAAVMFYMNWRLAILTLVPTPFIGYASYVLMK